MVSFGIDLSRFFSIFQNICVWSWSILIPENALSNVLAEAKALEFTLG